MHRVLQTISHLFLKNNWQWPIFILWTMATVTQPVFSAEMNHNKMRRDLDIAEEALKRILQYREGSQKESSWLDTDQIQSHYIEGYGAIFIIKSSLRKRNFEIGDRVKLRIKADGTGNVTQTTPDTAIPSTKILKQGRLAEFLKNYGPTIGQLKKNDHITIVLDTQTRGVSISMKVQNFITENMRHTPNHISDTLAVKMNALHAKNIKVNVLRSQDDKSTPERGVNVSVVTPDSVAKIDTLKYQMMVSKDLKLPHAATFPEREIIFASMQKSDLDTYQKQAHSDQNTMEGITFQTFSADSTLIKKIDILSGIIDTSIGLNTRSPLETQNQTLGAYIPNLGALFFIQNNQFAIMHTTDKKEPNTSFTDKLIEEILADYGATLRDIKPNEEVIIHVQAEYPQFAFTRVHSIILRNNQNSETQEDITQELDATKAMPDKFPGNIILRVQKKHLTDYATGKIDLKELHKQINISEY